MNRRERAPTLAQAAHSCVGVFDESGALHGWTTTFGSERGAIAAAGGIAGRSITDFVPEIGARRWAAIWAHVQCDVVEHVCFGRPGLGEDAVELVEVEVCKFVGADMQLAKVEVRRGNAADAQLRFLQQEILEGMASGIRLPEIMDLMCRRAESLAPLAICSLLRVDSKGRLQHLASPSLPEGYSCAIDGVAIGPNVGSCGTAIWRGEPVEVTDIANDPLWAPYKHLALPLGLRACWSSPIKATDGSVLGAFAFYFRETRGPTPLERQIVATCLGICSIALEHERTRRRIYELAFRDPLTQLDNRIRLQQRVTEALGVIAGTDQLLAIHYIGLDQFRAVNELLGHANGDEVLRTVARRLKGVMREGDIVARIGGDEFAVVQIGEVRAEDAAALARRLIEAIEQPFELKSQPLVVCASIGIAFARDDSASTEDLIKHAAMAMLRVKELGRGTYLFYERALNDRMQVRRALEGGLRSGVAAGEFELHYQPVLSAESLGIVAAEALMRWRHPKLGLIQPTDFIPIAEETGLIVPLGAWAIEQACRAAASWPEHVEVAVNLSPVQFERPGLVATVADALMGSGLRPSRLRLEITESVLLHDNAVNIAILDQLKDLGCSIALDDFGTGYSSLSYLQRFAFDRIKIDNSFVRSIGAKSDSLKIVRAIVMLAHSLSLSVTAEGVETDEQFGAVRGEGCDEIQGYYFGAAQPHAEFRQQLFDGVERIFPSVRTAS